ncbi:MAG: hypothetical protein ACJASL_002532 [Paraglaciecola sp.]
MTSASQSNLKRKILNHRGHRGFAAQRKTIKMLKNIYTLTHPLLYSFPSPAPNVLAVLCNEASFLWLVTFSSY